MIYKNHNETRAAFKKRCSAAGRKGALAKFARQSAGRDMCRRAGRYERLYTIRIENHLSGASQEIVIMQGDRANNYYVSCFGRCMGRAIGMHKVLTELAKRLVVRWMEL